MPTVKELQGQLRLVRRSVAGLQAKVNRAAKVERRLKDRIQAEKLKALGLVKGAKYRMIPLDRPGDILEGKFVRFAAKNSWNNSQLAVFRCPQTGRFHEQMRHLPIGEWEFERVNGRKK